MRSGRSAAQALSNRAQAGRYEAARPYGMPAGTWVDGQVANRNAICLCRSCRFRFNAKRHNYIAATRWGNVIGKCDGCREHTTDQTLYIHESGVCDTNGMIRSGHVYTPR